MTNKVDEFYPISETIKSCPNGIWQVGMIVKLTDHLSSAKAGNRESESRLINRIGQIRRSIGPMSNMTESLLEVFKEAIGWIRSTGRTVNLTSDDPAMWITARDGKTPRF